MIKNFFEKRFGKVLLFIITISFVLSSVGGILFFSNKYNVIVVNGNKINYKKFINLLTKEREFAYSNGETDIDYLTSKQFTLESVNKIINTELLKNFAKDNNLQIKKDFVIDKITSNDIFIENGEFNAEKYTKFLKNAKISEDEYIKSMTDYYSSIFLFNIFETKNNFDSDILKYIVDKNNEYVTVNLYEINKTDLNIDKINITDDELKKYYNANITRFTHNEERKIDFVKIDLTKTNKKINDDEIKNYYNSNLNKYKIPETYNIYYFESTKKDNLDKIIKSKNNQELLTNAKKFLNKNENEIIINELPIDILNYVFGEENVRSIKLNNFSKVIEKNNNYMAFYLKSRNEPKIIELEKVKDSIVSELQRDASDNYVRNNYNRIQNIIKGKKNISEISKTLNVSLDSLGYIKYDSAIDELKNEKQKMFSLNIDTIAQAFKGDYLYLYSVSDIKKQYYDKFDDIKEELINEVKKDKEDEIYLTKVSTKNKDNYKFKKNIVIKKNDNKYDKSFLEELYTLNNGETTKVYVGNTTLYFAYIINHKAIDKNDNNFISQKSIEDMFNIQINNSINYYYIEYLKERYKIFVNQNLLNYL